MAPCLYKLLSLFQALQAQEEERIAYIKSMLKAYVEFMRDCAPKTNDVCH